MGDDFYTLEQLRLEDSASEYSSGGEDASLAVMGELARAWAAGDEETRAQEDDAQEDDAQEDDAQGEKKKTSAATSKEEDIAFLMGAMKSASRAGEGAAPRWDPEAESFARRGEKMPGVDLEGDAEKEEDSDLGDGGAFAEENIFFDDDEDDRDRHFVQRHFRAKGAKRSDALLSCPGCFSTVAYDTSQHPRCKTWYTTARGFNYKLREPSTVPDEGDPSEAVIECAECSTALGVKRPDGTLEFQSTLPSALD